MVIKMAFGGLSVRWRCNFRSCRTWWERSLECQGSTRPRPAHVSWYVIEPPGCATCATSL